MPRITLLDVEIRELRSERRRLRAIADGLIACPRHRDITAAFRTAASLAAIDHLLEPPIEAAQ